MRRYIQRERFISNNAMSQESKQPIEGSSSIFSILSGE